MFFLQQKKKKSQELFFVLFQDRFSRAFSINRRENKTLSFCIIIYWYNFYRQPDMMNWNFVAVLGWWRNNCVAKLLSRDCLSLRQSRTSLNMLPNMNKKIVCSSASPAKRSTRSGKRAAAPSCKHFQTLAALKMWKSVSSLQHGINHHLIS